MSNKQRTDNLRAVPNEDKADLSPQQIGAETRRKNAEIADKKNAAGRKLRLAQHLDKMNCPHCHNKAKNIHWTVIATYDDLRYCKCSHCPHVAKVIVE